MLKKFRINVDGRIYNVAVEELPADGIEALGTPPIHTAAAPAAAASGPPPPAAPASAPPAPAAAGAGDVVAPLAGVVVSIDVGVGAKVKAGDKVAVVEAMKMKTDVYAKHSGTVTRIAVAVHEGVETGQILLSVG